MNPEDAAAWEEIYLRKHEGREVFAHAELLEPIEMRVWNGTHPSDANTEVHTATAGTKVFITCYSRFGHVGIRDDNLESHCHGYYGVALPDQIQNIRFVDDGGNPWRKSLLEQLRKSD
jgi:hypothetical protein